MKSYRLALVTTLGLAIAAPVLAVDAQTPARVLIWAKPGTSGDATEPRNWTAYASAGDYAAGKADMAGHKLPDANTDIVLPDAPEGGNYIVGFFDGGRRQDAYREPPRFACRNITIGRAAALDGGAGQSRGQTVFSSHPDLDAGLEIHGDVTVADGGYLYAQLVFAGGRDATFTVGKTPEPLATRLIVRKSAKARLTIRAGEYNIVRGVHVETGRLVLASGTHLGFNATRAARESLGKMRKNRMQEIAKADVREDYVYVHKGATLELQPGASLARIKTPDNPVADIRLEGTLAIPAPATGASAAPTTLGLCFAKGDGGFLDQPGGLYVRPTGRIVNNGKLVVTAADPNGSAKTDTGVSVFLETPADFGDVTFDYLRSGGIVSRDPAATKAALAKATFGEHCAATGDARFAKLDLTDFAGGTGTVAFVDGLKTECEILYPHEGRLIVRSKGNRTSQSFDLASVHSLTIAGKTTEFNPSRPLNDQEKELRKYNALWADVPGPGQVGKYGKYVWPKAPLLVWRHPGVSGSRFVGPNWLDANGVPLFESPFDVESDFDVLMPAAAQFYMCEGFGCGGMARAVACRHLTIEYNAQYGSSFNVMGNCWMKHGSGIRGRQLGSFNNTDPNVHRFMRFDGLRHRKWTKKDESPFAESCDYTMSQWGNYVTGPGATLELIGQIRGAADHSRVAGEGTLIISEGGYLTEGERSAFSISPGATVVLLQDARIGHETTQQQDVCKASVWVGGTLMIGMPNRPITHDMLFPVAGVLEDKISRDPAGSERTAGVSLLVSKPGRLAVYSANPTKARVIFKLHDSDKAKQRGSRYGHPKGIVLDFAGEADLNGVVFDNILAGGIMASNDQRAKWKNIFYGDHDLAAPDKLYWTPEEKK